MQRLESATFAEFSNIRRFLGITQQELGRRVGISTATIRNYEKNPKTMQVGTLLDIAAALGVDPAELIKIRRLDNDKDQSLF